MRRERASPPADGQTPGRTRTGRQWGDAPERVWRASSVVRMTAASHRDERRARPATAALQRTARTLARSRIITRQGWRRRRRRRPNRRRAPKKLYRTTARPAIASDEPAVPRPPPPSPPQPRTPPPTGVKLTWHAHRRRVCRMSFLGSTRKKSKAEVVDAVFRRDKFLEFQR